MASKFQNRLAGTIVLVAVIVIALPSLLDGQKKKYQQDFAAIPLVPKLSDTLDKSALQPIEPLPDTVNTSLDKRQSRSTTSTQLAQGSEGNDASGLPFSADVQQQAIEQQQDEQQRQQATRLKAEASNQVAEKKKQDAARQLEQQRALAILNGATPSANSTRSSNYVVGQAGRYVLQLGAFTNALRVHEQILLLRSKGFNAYSLPATPKANQLNRILLGPSDSKEELERLQTKIDNTLQLKGMIITNPANNR